MRKHFLPVLFTVCLSIPMLLSTAFASDATPAVLTPAMNDNQYSARMYLKNELNFPIVIQPQNTGSQQIKLNPGQVKQVTETIPPNVEKFFEVDASFANMQKLKVGYYNISLRRDGEPVVGKMMEKGISVGWVVDSPTITFNKK